MDPERRMSHASKIAKNYLEEVSALRNAGMGYKVGFGLLLIILFPILLLQVLLVLLCKKDIGVFVPRQSELQPELIVEEVPESLHGLIPLGQKFGIGDDSDSDDILKAASSAELAELEEKVLAQAEEIENWLDTFPETEISDTASFFLHLGSACDEVPLYKPEKKS